MIQYQVRLDKVKPERSYGLLGTLPVGNEKVRTSIRIPRLKNSGPRVKAVLLRKEKDVPDFGAITAPITYFNAASQNRQAVLPVTSMSLC